jgi:hypothetical protein
MTIGFAEAWRSEIEDKFSSANILHFNRCKANSEFDKTGIFSEEN